MDDCRPCQSRCRRGTSLRDAASGEDAAATALTRNNDYIGTDAAAQFWHYEWMMRKTPPLLTLARRLTIERAPGRG